MHVWMCAAQNQPDSGAGKAFCCFLDIVYGMTRDRGTATSRDCVLANGSRLADTVCLCRDGIKLGAPQKIILASFGIFY